MTPFYQKIPRTRTITSLTSQSTQEMKTHRRENNFNQNSGAHRAPSTPAGEERQSHNTYTEDVQDHSSMSPVLVREDVIGEFMESCKKRGGGERKLRCLISYSHPPRVLLSDTARGCPTQPCSHLPEALPHLPVAQLTLSSGTTFPQMFTVPPASVASTALRPTGAQGGTDTPLEHSTAPSPREAARAVQSRCSISWRGWQLSSHCPAIHRTIERSTPCASQPLLQTHCASH